MQITVYVPKDLEGKIVGLAEANGQTVQQVLLSPWRGGHKITKSVEERLDRIESKLDSLATAYRIEHAESPIDEFKKIKYEHQRYGLEVPVFDGTAETQVKRDPVLREVEEKTIREKKIELSKGKDLSPKISPADEAMLKEKMELIAKKKPESLTGWVGGYSKAQQTRKGAK